MIPISNKVFAELIVVLGKVLTTMYLPEERRKREVTRRVRLLIKKLGKYDDKKHDR
jgi:hypothetical protein